MRVLVFPFPLLAHILRCAEYTRTNFPDAEVTFAGREIDQSTVSSFGYQLAQCEQFDPHYVLQCAREFRFDWLNLQSIQRVYESHLSLVREMSPDLIISDTSQVGRMIGEKTKTHHVSLVNGYMSRYYKGTRGLPENHPAKKFEHHLPPTVFNTLVRGVESLVMRKVHAPFLALRKKEKLPRTPHYLAEYEGDETLICDDPRVFPQRELPGTHRVIGPLFYTGLRPRQECVPHSNKVLYVTLGSSGEWDKIHLLGNPIFHEYKIYISGNTPSHVTGPHITSIPFIEPHEILPHASAVICHGGNGTIYQSLSYRVPVLCRPSSFEQEYNVSAFEKAGLVTRIPVNITATTLKELLESIISSSSK